MNNLTTTFTLWAAVIGPRQKARRSKASTSATRSAALTAAGAAEVLDRLSPQEKRVLALMAEGLTNSAIALHLMLSPYTVRGYTSTIYQKLGVSRRAEAAARFAAISRVPEGQGLPPI